MSRLRDRLVPPALRVGAFRRLVIAATLSRLGNAMTYVALPVVAWQETGSTATFAAILAAGSTGIILATPFGGVVADRFDRRLLMLIGTFKASLVGLCMLWAVHVDAWSAMPAITFVGTVLGSLTASAAPALRRDVVPDELRESAMAALQMGVQSAKIAGPLLGAAVLAATSFEWVIASEMLTMLAAFVVVLRFRHPGSRPVRAPDVVVVGVARRACTDLAAGAAASWHDPFLRWRLIYTVISGLGNATLLIVAIPWLEHVGVGASAWGVLLAVLAGSGVIASVVLSAFGERIGAGRLMLGGAVAPVLTLPIWLGWHATVAIAVAFAVFGAAQVAVSVGVEATVQRRVPSHLMGRVSSLPMTVFQAAMLAASLLAAWLVHAAGPVVAISFLAGSLVVEALCGVAMARRARVPVERTADGELVVSA